MKLVANTGKDRKSKFILFIPKTTDRCCYLTCSLSLLIMELAICSFLFPNIHTEIYRLMNRKQMANAGGDKAAIASGQKISLGKTGDKATKKKGCC